MFRGKLLTILMVTIGLLAAQAVSAEHRVNNVLFFGVVPQQASEKLAKQWIPLANYLSEETGLRIEFSTAPDIPEFERRLADGEYDLAYMNPYHFTVFNEDPGYKAVVRQRDHAIRGIMVVPADSKFETLADLKGLSLAFPAPRAFAATLITRSFLDETAPGYQTTFVNSHDSVYRSVAKGLFAAGGGIVRTFNEVDPQIQSQLNILWHSPGYTGHAIAAHPTISASVREKVQKALIGIETVEEGRRILEGLGMKGFQNAKDEDWDDVRDLGIDS